MHANFADLTPDGFHFWMSLSPRTSELVRHATCPPEQNSGDATGRKGCTRFQFAQYHVLTIDQTMMYHVHRCSHYQAIGGNCLLLLFGNFKMHAITCHRAFFVYMHLKLLPLEAFFSPKCSKYRSAAGLCPDPLQELTACGSSQRSPRSPSWIKRPYF